MPSPTPCSPPSAPPEHRWACAPPETGRPALHLNREGSLRPLSFPVITVMTGLFLRGGDISQSWMNFSAITVTAETFHG
jgi:hypothetical protein